MGNAKEDEVYQWLEQVNEDEIKKQYEVDVKRYVATKFEYYDTIPCYFEWLMFNYKNLRDGKPTELWENAEP